MRRRLYWQKNSSTAWSELFSFVGFQLSFVGFQLSIILIIFALIQLNTSPIWLMIALPISGVMLTLFLIARRKNQQFQNAHQQKASLQKENTPRIPKHYTIGDDGQIVELKKPNRKRSKKAASAIGI